MEKEYKVIELLEFAALIEESIKNVIEYRRMLYDPLFEDFGGLQQHQSFEELYTLQMLILLRSQSRLLEEQFLEKARTGE